MSELGNALNAAIGCGAGMLTGYSMTDYGELPQAGTVILRFPANWAVT